MTLKLLSIGVALGALCASNAWAAEWAEGPAAPSTKPVSGGKENKAGASEESKEKESADSRGHGLRIRTPSIGGGITYGAI